MPNTTKNKRYYILKDGKNYRDISKFMSKKGHKMNHATVRHIFLEAMKKLYNTINDTNQTQIINSEEMEELFLNEEFQSASSELFFKIFNDKKE